MKLGTLQRIPECLFLFHSKKNRLYPITTERDSVASMASIVNLVTFSFISVSNMCILEEILYCFRLKCKLHNVSKFWRSQHWIFFQWENHLESLSWKLLLHPSFFLNMSPNNYLHKKIFLLKKHLNFEHSQLFHSKAEYFLYIYLYILVSW